MAVYIPREVREQVWNDAKGLCGYCLTHEDLVGIAHEFEHLTPRAKDGPTKRENLWLSCRRCNSFKGDRIEAIDPQTGETAALFHPRQEEWNEHFRWCAGGIEIRGISPVGRATVEALQLNLPIVMKARSVWILSGRFPPPGD